MLSTAGSWPAASNIYDLSEPGLITNESASRCERMSSTIFTTSFLRFFVSVDPLSEIGLNLSSKEEATAFTLAALGWLRSCQAQSSDISRWMWCTITMCRNLFLVYHFLCMVILMQSFATHIFQFDLVSHWDSTHLRVQLRGIVIRTSTSHRLNSYHSLLRIQLSLLFDELYHSRILTGPHPTSRCTK